MPSSTRATVTDFLAKNRRLTEDTLRGYGERLAAGRITPGEFERLVATEIKASSAAAFRFALGRAPVPGELNTLNTILVRQGDYLARFGADIAMADDLGFVANRAALYASSTVQAEAAGHLTRAEEGTIISWHGTDGANSCPDCARLIGRSWPKAEFLAMGIAPAAGTACGPACRCRLAAS